jgi:hypothetical protein
VLSRDGAQRSAVVGAVHAGRCRVVGPLRGTPGLQGKSSCRRPTRVMVACNCCAKVTKRRGTATYSCRVKSGEEDPYSYASGIDHTALKNMPAIVAFESFRNLNLPAEPPCACRCEFVALNGTSLGWCGANVTAIATQHTLTPRAGASALISSACCRLADHHNARLHSCRPACLPHPSAKAAGSCCRRPTLTAFRHEPVDEKHRRRPADDNRLDRPADPGLPAPSALW